jgi:lipid-A-disaccharide synthase
MGDDRWRFQEIRPSRRIAISAGEASGDLHGASLVCEVRKLLPEAEFWGAGGERMRDAGVRIVVDTTGGGTIGIAQSLKSLPGLALKYHKLKRQIFRQRPDLLVLIDYGAFNTRLGRAAWKAGIEVVYYLPPSSWRKHAKNAETLLWCGGKVITPFPWSAEGLGDQGVDARFVGHPLIDIAKPTCSRQEFISELGISADSVIVGLFPGSRSHEVSGHLRPMLACASELTQKLGNVVFIMGAAGRADTLRLQVEKLCAGLSPRPDVRVVEGRTYDCMASSDFAIIASGTATLEAAIIGTPMIIIYAGTWLMRFEFIFRKAILEQFIGLPNIVAGRLLCPEVLGKDVNGPNLARMSLEYLCDADRLGAARCALSDVREVLGKPGALARAAKELLDLWIPNTDC